MRYQRHQAATSIIEYMIILAFMSLSAISVIGTFGETLKESIRASGEALEGSTGVPNCGAWGQPPC